MRLCKLTNQQMLTHGGCQWEIGEWKEVSGEGELCGPGWLHAYESPYLAALMNPLHADIRNPRLFRATGEGLFKDDNGLKCGVTRLKLTSEMGVPEYKINQRVAFGIFCALEVCRDKNFREWARNWLSGGDRSSDAAAEAAAAAAWVAEAEAAGRTNNFNLKSIAKKAYNFERDEK